MTEFPVAPFEMQREAWASQAACKGADPNIFVMDQGYTASEAIKYCKRCSVTEECADYARRTRSIGVFGGKLFSYRHSQPVELLPLQPVQDARPYAIRMPSDTQPLILGAPVDVNRPLILGR